MSDCTVCRLGGVTIRLRMPLEPAEISMLASEGKGAVSFEALSALCVITFGTDIKEAGAHLAPQPGQNCHLLDKLALQVLQTLLLPQLPERLSPSLCFLDDGDRLDDDELFRSRLDPVNIPCRRVLHNLRYS